MIDENKCGGGIDLFITYVRCEKEKKIEKEKKKEECVRQEKKKKVWKKWINVPFPDDLGGCFEVKAQQRNTWPLSFIILCLEWSVGPTRRYSALLYGYLNALLGF